MPMFSREFRIEIEILIVSGYSHRLGTAVQEQTRSNDVRDRRYLGMGAMGGMKRLG